MSPGKMIKSVDRFLATVEEWTICILLGVVLIIVSFAVLNRFILNFPFSWSEELARYLMIWAVFIGASLGVREGVHISVDALFSALSPRARYWMELVTYLACAALCFLLLRIGVSFIERLMMTNQLSPAMRIPIIYAYLAVPTGFGMMGFRYLLKAFMGRAEGRISAS